MNKGGIKNHEKAFTLIELLIVIGILSILATITLLVINPIQLVKQSRDGNRLAEINQINQALLVYQSFGGSSLGTHETVYVSIPSSQADCSDLGLSALGGGYVYACADSAHYRNIDGTGWIPVDFTSVQSNAGSLFSNLPTDPINTVAGGLYYTYIPGSWALSATMESDKYIASNAANDGGQVSSRFEIGNELSLNANLSGMGGGTIYATGGTITTDGDYTIHTFTSNGTFTVTSGSGNAEVLIVAGGGSGGRGDNTGPWPGGGGGAGGVLYLPTLALAAGDYGVTVGAGGTQSDAGNNGGDSLFGANTAYGGGKGGRYGIQCYGYDGGSGGGNEGYYGIPCNGGVGSSGVEGQGYGGGINSVSANYGGGGGGGAGAAGTNGSTSANGPGGVGVSNGISGTVVYYGGGGGAGGSASGVPAGAAGGNGGGGAGGNSTATGTDGTANTGGGGGGGGSSGSGGGHNAGSGGSGIVIVRYLTP